MGKLALSTPKWQSVSTLLSPIVASGISLSFSKTGAVDISASLAKRYTTQLFGIIIQGKSVSCEALFKKGIITLEDLTTEENGVITDFQIMASTSFTPKEKFQLMAIIDAIPMQWRHHLKSCNNY